MLTQYPRMNSPTNEKTKFVENFHDFFGKVYKTPSNVRKWDFFPRTVIHKMNGLFSILEMKEDEWTLIDF